MKTIIASIFLLIFTVGCAHKETVKEVIVYKTEYVVVAPTDIQLKKVTVVPPPDKQLWMSLSDNSQQSWMKKESILTDLYIKQTSAVQQCNASLQEIKEWRQKQIDNYKQKREAKSP